MFIQLGSTIDGADSSDYEANAVALSSDGMKVAIGVVSQNDIVTYYSRYVRGFLVDGLTWNRLGQDILGLPRKHHLFGLAFAFSAGDNMLAIATPPNNSKMRGYVSFYTFDGISWIRVADDIVGDVNGDRFGKQGNCPQ